MTWRFLSSPEEISKRKVRRVTPEQAAHRARVQQLLEEGKNFHEVAQITGRSYATIYQMARAWGMRVKAVEREVSARQASHNTKIGAWRDDKWGPRREMIRRELAAGKTAKQIALDNDLDPRGVYATIAKYGFTGPNYRPGPRFKKGRKLAKPHTEIRGEEGAA